MSSIRSDIGHLASLFAFEAAGRLGSFTRAARELGVTQAAVSKQIVALETRLGTRLFTRRPRHVDLTSAGQELFRTTTVALGTIARTMRDLQKGGHPPLTIALSMAMSQFWLMPILPEFTMEHPDVPVRIIAQDDLDQVTDADLVISFEGRAPAGAVRLFDADVVAMASPKFLAARRVETVSDVIAAPLIHYDAPNRSWITWKDWAIHAGINPGSLTPALSFSRYQDALIAAHRDQGVVLVWSIVGRALIANGDLEAVPGPRIPASGAFYLKIMDPDVDGIAKFIAWLERAAGEEIPPA